MQGITNQNPNQPQNARTSTIDVPVRILVPSESVGAIIGKGGQTIRQLTQQTRAKVDVYRGDPMAPNTALQEKVITIRGQPENCINACREILKVMKVDAESKGKPSDAPLKVLAHNDYIGRIIGKQGNIINTIKKETETTVTVSSINDMSMNVERVITVKGELENMIRALEIIHSKVKSAFENDTKTYGAQAIMMGGIPPLPLAPPLPLPFAAATAAAQSVFQNGNGPSSGSPAARFAAAAAAAAVAAQQQGPGGVGPNGPNQQSSSQNGPQTSSGQYSNYYQPMYHPGQVAPHHHHQQQQQHQQQSHQQGPSPQSNHNMFQAAGGAGGNQGNLMHQSNGPQGQHQHMQSQQQQQQQLQLDGGLSQVMGGPDTETVYLYIPNVAVGAIIGTKGSYIKNIIKLSGASVKITPMTPEESKEAVERQVVISGTPESQWKAQYYIYDKIRQERFASDENVKLRAELQVPSHIVGRIIGKSGKNVRELQRSTGATIKLPEDAASNHAHSQSQEQSDTTATAAAATTNSESENTAEETSETSQAAQVEESVVSTTETTDNKEAAASDAAAATSTDVVSSSEAKTDESVSFDATATTSTNEGLENPENPSTSATPLQGYVIVRIFGTFQASQCAQRRIQSLVSQSLRGVSGPSIIDVQNPMRHQHDFHQQQQQQLHHLALGPMGGNGGGMSQRSFNNMSNHYQQQQHPHHHQMTAGGMMMPIASNFHHRGGNGSEYSQPQHHQQNGRVNGTFSRQNRTQRQHQQQQQSTSKDSSFNSQIPAATETTTNSAGQTQVNNNNMSNSSNSSSPQQQQHQQQNDQEQSPSVSSSSTTTTAQIALQPTTTPTTNPQSQQAPIIAATS
jgi:predicted RNA-binding protein YlqC (UPF0109 family)